MLSAKQINGLYRFSSFVFTALIGVVFLLALVGQWQHRSVIELGWRTRASGDAAFVQYVNRHGPAAGVLAPGDQVLAINGSTKPQLLFLPESILASEQSYSVRVLRSGRIITAKLPIFRQPSLVWIMDANLVVGLIYVALTATLLLQTASSGLIQITVLVFLAIAKTISSIAFGAFPPFLPDQLTGLLPLLYIAITRPLEAAALFDFAVRFPVDVAQPRWLLMVRRGLYWFSALLFCFGLLPELALIFNLPSRSALWPFPVPLAVWDHWHGSLIQSEVALVAMSLPVLLFANYRRIPAESERRKLRFVGLGVSLAALPIGLGFVFRALLAYVPSPDPDALQSIDFFRDTVGTFGTVLIPISITYAIIRHRLLGIRLTIRRGLQYLLARNVLRVILSGPLLLAAIYMVRHSNEPLRDLVLHGSLSINLFFALTAAASLRYRKRLATWVDRRFFRSAYEEEVILSDLIERMQQAESPYDVARTVAEQLQDIFQPTGVCVIIQRRAFQRTSDRTTVIYPQHSPLAAEFCADEAPVTTDPAAGTRLFPPSASTDLETRCSLWERRYPEGRVTVIRAAQGQTVGVLLLGAKKSEQLYTKRDTRLLTTLSVQIGIVIEMLALKDQVRDDERIRAEVLGRLDQQDFQLVLECPACGRCYERPHLACRVDDTPLELTLPIERVIDGKYRLERRIGAGGMGVVYAASDLRLSRMVAVKVITGRLFGNTQALRRFEREARTVATLQHPGIVNVFDFGTLRGGGAYIVMQLIAGHSWRAEMNSHGALAPARAAIWFDQLCDALACAHDAGVLHRDLKPENLLVTPGAPDQDRVTILDFGLAKCFSTGPADPTLSVEGHALGTHGYMSPEQRQGIAVDRRTDLYSLGVLTAEVLTHIQPPTVGSSPNWIQSVLQSQTAGASSPASWRQLCALIMQSVAEDPQQRPSDVRQFRRQLIPLLLDCPAAAPMARGATPNGDNPTLVR